VFAFLLKQLQQRLGLFADLSVDLLASAVNDKRLGAIIDRMEALKLLSSRVEH